MLELETLRVIWWMLTGVLLMGFAVMDGFDLGSAMLLPFVAKTDQERRVVINSIGPFWEGNQVWFILGGGAVFAAWPLLYGAAFSSLYLGLFIVLVALIIRPASIVYRSKLPDPRWRGGWDWSLFVSGLVCALLFGVVFGNLFRGIAFAFDADLRARPEITLFGLLSPFALLVGLVSVAMLVLHGAAWLRLKTEGDVATRARRVMPFAAIAFALLFTAAGLWLMSIDGYRITSVFVADAPSNPLMKTVARVRGGWFANFDAHPSWWIVPVIAYAAVAIAALTQRALVAFLASSAVCIFTVGTAGIALFPFLLPSSLSPDSSLTVWDASSTQTTLSTMLIAALIFLPIILAYTAWIHRVMGGGFR
ncbi:MAG TPA: cytochrome d ubiquinol oxidase subunit II, partial [Rhizomicrobium sp.]|nr:cytochrome d ubiquinol oxidase subunit II [Rhizomicrobium sp.]